MLTHDLPKRRDATSWRGWGGIQTEAQAAEEKQRIEAELTKLKKNPGFALEVLPIATPHKLEEAATLAKGDHDVMLMYAAGGDGRLLETLTTPEKWNLMFLRHDSGPVYLWYEIVHPRFLRKTVDAYGQPGFAVEDVAVDAPKKSSGGCALCTDSRTRWARRWWCVIWITHCGAAWRPTKAPWKWLGAGAARGGLSRPLGEELLIPTRIYVKTVLALIRDFPVRGIAHITGGGFTDNIPRVVPKGCKLVIRKGTWPIPPIFKVLREGGKVGEDETFRTFNNGIGLVLIAPSSKAGAVCDRLADLREKPYRIGEIAKAGRGDRPVEYR